MMTRSTFHELIHNSDIDESTFTFLLDNAPVKMTKDLLFHKSLPQNLRIPLIGRVYSAPSSEISPKTKLDYFYRLLKSRNWDLHSQEFLKSKIRKLENVLKNNIPKEQKNIESQKYQQRTTGQLAISPVMKILTPLGKHTSCINHKNYYYQRLTEVSDLSLSTLELRNHEELVNKRLYILKHDFMSKYLSPLNLSPIELGCLWRLFTLQVSQLGTSYSSDPGIMDQFESNLQHSLEPAFTNDIAQECARVSHPSIISMRVAFRILASGGDESYYSQVFSIISNLSSSCRELPFEPEPEFSGLTLVEAGYKYLAINYFGNLASAENPSYLKYAPAGDDLEIVGFPKYVEYEIDIDLGRVKYQGIINNLKPATEYSVKLITTIPDSDSHTIFKFSTIKIPVHVFQARSRAENYWNGNNSRFDKGG
jgi:hypothetical protein